jgi:hypothetical protein
MRRAPASSQEQAAAQNHLETSWQLIFVTGVSGFNACTARVEWIGTQPAGAWQNFGRPGDKFNFLDWGRCRTCAAMLARQ